MNSVRKYEQGLSIVEIMVSMVIGFLILAGMLSVYLSNSASFRFNSQMARIQESGRLVLNLLENDIRMSAYGGCVKTTLDEEDYEPGIEIDSAVPTTTISVDQLLQGVEWNGSDTLIVYGIPAPEDAADTHIYSNCDGDTIIVAKGTPPAATPVEISVPIISKVTYTLDSTSSVLKVKRGSKSEAELVENVDKFNVCLGIDTNMDESVDNWITTATSGLSDKQKQRITAVKVDLILASAQSENVLSNAVEPSITLCDSTTWDNSGVSDQRLHKLFHSTIALRNKVANGYGNCDGTVPSSRCEEIGK
jgi:type IV pilus assembly protein PilW